MSNNRSGSTILLHGMCGGFLGALILIAVQFWVGPIKQFYVLLGAIFGFLLAAIYGEDALEFLKDIFKWS